MPANKKDARRRTTADENGATKGSGVDVQPPTAERERPVIFEYPALPRIEIAVYFALLVAALTYSWYCVFDVSRKYKWKRPWGWRYEQLPFIGTRRKDATNYEWDKWMPLSYRLAVALVGHSLLFNVSAKFLAKERKFLWQLLTTAYAVAASTWLYGPTTVAVTIAQGLFLFTVARIIRYRMAVWIAMLPVLYISLHHATWISEQNPFLALILCSYSMLKYISYNLEAVGDNVPSKDWLNSLWDMYYYVFYMPYQISLIVIYPKFCKQMQERELRPRNLKSTLIFGLRIAFWHAFCDFVLHFLYFEAILLDKKELYRITEDRLVALGYALGQFFHLKYVVIFGLPAFFAKLDKMVPPAGPVCITRVALYSKIWRQFDRGLYDFFKLYIFLPICAPTFSIPRKLVGMFVSYGFVLIWHGTEHHNIVWIALNLAELMMEAVAKSIYVIPKVKAFREARLSDRNLRRVLAWLQVCPFAFALYSNFYFLSGSTAGYVFVDRIFYGETTTIQWPFLLLISVGYCYSHVCMECERLISDREKRQKIEQGKKKE